MSNGLIERAFLCGNHNPQQYYKKFPRQTWNQKGGYEIQTTPGEIAAAISQSRGWVKGHRMLAVGTQTLGSERFIAESMGMLEVDYIGDALPTNTAMDGIKVNKVLAPAGKYDLVTVFGTAKVDKLKPYFKIGTFVIFLGIGRQEKNPDLRNAWMGVRKKHMTMLQTGGEPWQTGIGVLKILFTEGDNAVQIESTESVDVQERAGDGEAVGSGNPERENPPEESKEAEVNQDDQKTPVKWSRAHDKCVECGKTEQKHVAKGLCKTCYPKVK